MMWFQAGDDLAFILDDFDILNANTVSTEE
jgi:hypothetical protein